MNARFVITLHALRRFIERYAGIEDVNLGQYRPFITAELERAVCLGGARRTSQLYLLPCGLVAAVVWHDHKGFVKTVLTREHAIASMKSLRPIVRPARPLRHQIPDARTAPSTLDSKQKDALRALARQHFNAEVGWKERNASLREHGYDPVGTAGEIYRAAYQALERAKWAAA